MNTVENLISNKIRTINIDIDSVRNVFSSVDLNTSSSQGLYSNEYLTQDYISSLYKETKNAIDMFNRMKLIAVRYGLNVESLPSPNPPIGKIKGTNVNFREGARTNSDSIRKFMKGEEVTIIEDGVGGWKKVKTEQGEEGFVKEDYLIIDDQE